MTKRERIIAAIQHKETDFVPYQVEFTQTAYQKLVDYTGDPNFGEKIGNHIAGAAMADQRKYARATSRMCLGWSGTAQLIKTSEW